LCPLFLFSQDTTFNKKLDNITVTSVTKKETNVAVLNIIRNSFVVSDGLSIEFIKKTPDRTVGDALKRINGVTIQNDKFVLIRGLADRYNLALLNKTLLPSTEPDRRAFSFDIIPSALVDNIIIAKSAAANLPGDFAGGVVQITTKDVSNNFFSLSTGLSYGTISTFQKFKLVGYTPFPEIFPSTYQFRIGSNGDKRAYTRLVNSPIMKTISSVPNTNSSFSFGLKKNKWNLVFSSVYRNSYSINYTDRQDYQSSTELAYKYKDTSYTNTQLLNGLANITYIGKNKYSLKTLFNHQIEQLYLTRNGENYDNVQDVRSNASNHVVKTVINSQFDGKIKTLDFNLGYNLMLRDQPDYRVNPITKSLGTNEPYSVAWRDTYRFWSVMNENSFNGGINKAFNNVKVGANYLKKIRNFQARIFRYEATDMLNEITNNTDKYKADFDLATTYAMYDNDFGKWKLNTGLRSEYNLFNVNTADFSGQKVNVNRKYLDILPSLNLSYNLDKTKFRLSASKTLARPEFREVANFAYYDFIRNAQILGNSKLEKSNIYNLDLKYEYYSKPGENISVALFSKNFIKPIEQIVADGSVPSNLLLTFTNPNKATVYGIEFELRKKINNWLDFYTNSSLIHSEVKVNNIKRQLQGQSNYIVNGGLNFHKNKNTLNVTYNRVGDRLSAVGFQGYADIFENSRNILDVVYLRKINKGEIKIAINDLFAQPSIYYQKTKGNLITTNNEQTISLTVNFNL
jgi:outer membrane receptor protein involved in Fe transport